MAHDDDFHRTLAQTIKAIHDAAWLLGADPPAPSALTIDEFELSWSASPNATMYSIERADAEDGPWTWFGSTIDTAFIATELLDGWFRVTATNEAFRGPPSEAVQAIEDETEPPIPPEPEPGDDLHEDLTNPPPERNQGDVANLRNAVRSGQPIADGIYRLTLDRQSDPALHIPGGVTFKAQNPKKVWLLLSRNWAPNGEAGCTWQQTGNYWTSSRNVPNIGTNEPGGVSYEDQAKALRYEMCVGVDANGGRVHFSSIAANGTPNAGQFCLDGNRRIRLGRNPADFRFLEVVEAPSGPGRWFWPDGDGITIDNIVMRYAPSGPSADPAGSHDRHNFTMRNCVIGDVHGTALNCGGSRNVRIEDCLIEWAGNSGCTTYNVDGLQFNRNQIYDCGRGGWDVLWQGGATKFTVTRNHIIDGIVIDGCRGSGLWWDESNTGPITVDAADVRNCEGPLFHYEISTGPVYVGKTKPCLFAYNTFAGGWPVFYISSSTGPGEIANCLIISGSNPNTRGLQAYWAQDRSNDKVVKDWHWHDCQFIQEGSEPCIFVGGGAEGQNNTGANNQYHFANGQPRWSAGSEYRDINAWNGTKFEENGRLVDAATAKAWRDAWDV